ncbi:hypothetical protein RCL_jg26320.t1 [Rhizophagus clarus]|uniref:Uncharacterized protein n=1 Tax=Rhizophagus clarus TaxID=94130 RepID=A0A8H3QD99_9GLOM|nr:hypothetical protein RCL_jg26320.t1 [Rhizophagus clarus]
MMINNGNDDYIATKTSNDVKKSFQVNFCLRKPKCFPICHLINHRKRNRTPKKRFSLMAIKKDGNSPL